MSDEEKEGNKSGAKPRKDWAIHINQVEILGRVCGKAKKRKGEKVGVPIMVPTYKKGGGRQWMPLTIDVVGEDRGKAMEANVGDYMGCTCRIIERRVTDDNGDDKGVKVLQVDPYREVSFMPGEVGEGYEALEPPLPTICYTRALIVGRHFIRKKQIKEGQLTPILREGQNGKYCYANFTYQDPFQEVPDGAWPKDLFFDVSLSNKAAERVSEHCRNRALVVVRGELTKKELDFTVNGKSPKEVRISLIPDGFKFMNLDRSGGQQKEQKAAEGYDDGDTGGIDGLDDDLPFN